MGSGCVLWLAYFVIFSKVGAQRRLNERSSQLTETFNPDNDNSDTNEPPQKFDSQEVNELLNEPDNDHNDDEDGDNEDDDTDTTEQPLTSPIQDPTTIATTTIITTTQRPVRKRRHRHQKHSYARPDPGTAKHNDDHDNDDDEEGSEDDGTDPPEQTSTAQDPTTTQRPPERPVRKRRRRHRRRHSARHPRGIAEYKPKYDTTSPIENSKQLSMSTGEISSETSALPPKSTATTYPTVKKLMTTTVTIVATEKQKVLTTAKYIRNTQTQSTETKVPVSSTRIIVTPSLATPKVTQYIPYKTPSSGNSNKLCKKVMSIITSKATDKPASSTEPTTKYSNPRKPDMTSKQTTDKPASSTEAITKYSKPRKPDITSKQTTDKPASSREATTKYCKPRKPDITYKETTAMSTSRPTTSSPGSKITIKAVTKPMETITKPPPKITTAPASTLAKTTVTAKPSESKTLKETKSSYSLSTTKKIQTPTPVTISAKQTETTTESSKLKVQEPEEPNPASQTSSDKKLHELHKKLALKKITETLLDKGTNKQGSPKSTPDLEKTFNLFKD